MADPPDNCAAYATPSSTTAPSHLDAVGAEDPTTSNTNIIPTQTVAASYSNTNAAVVKDSLSAADGAAAILTSVHKITLALTMDAATHKPSTAALTSQQTGTANEEHGVASANTNPSLFAKLPGELRNRIYRAYFEDSARQRKHTMNIKKAAPTFLNLFQTDRMIRSESTSIFFREFFSVDSSFAPQDLEAAIMLRIKSICALVGVHDVELSLSITVQESSVHGALYNAGVRSDFVGKLMRFVSNETNEWFTSSTRPHQAEERRSPHPSHDLRSEKRVHSSQSYRIERLHPSDAPIRFIYQSWYQNPINEDTDQGSPWSTLDSSWACKVPTSQFEKAPTFYAWKGHWQS